MTMLSNGVNLLGVENNLRTFNYRAVVEFCGGERLYVEIPAHYPYSLEAAIKNAVECHLENQFLREGKGSCVVPDDWEERVRYNKRFEAMSQDLRNRRFETISEFFFSGGSGGRCASTGGTGSGGSGYYWSV